MFEDIFNLILLVQRVVWKCEVLAAMEFLDISEFLNSELEILSSYEEKYLGEE